MAPFRDRMERIKEYLFRLKFNSNAYSKIIGRRPMICMGDSHISVFKHIEKNGLLRQYVMDVVEVGGATAQGLINPNSKTDALAIFKSRIKQAGKFQTLLFQLGEVDCGFVIWYYAEKHAVSIEEQLERSLKNYISFIEEVRRNGYKDVIVLSAPLPTIADGQDWGDVANLRRAVKASQKERTELTVRYNGLLAERCRGAGIRFIDTTGCLLDQRTCLIKDEFMNKDGLDHHLDAQCYAELICALLNQPPGQGD